jgi:4'-phosphopantetheinyl transferase
MRNKGNDRVAGIDRNPPLIAATDIGAAQIGVAQCHLDDDRDIALSAAWALLSADETTRAQRFHFDRDRTRYVRGRGFLRQMLGQVCRQDPASLIFGTGAQGKPFLQGSTLAFNLSHSRDLAVLVVSQTGPVGIDLEFIDRSADIAGLTQSCMTPPEAAVLAALPADERQARFFAFWTAKEARMKLTGMGMSLPPQQIALDLRAGVPVGYLRPRTPDVQAIFLDLGTPAIQCCLALAQGPQPVITPLINTTPSNIITSPPITERAYYGSL